MGRLDFDRQLAGIESAGLVRREDVKEVVEVPGSHGLVEGELNTRHGFLAHNARMVEEWSDGRLGYIHIQGMNQPSLDVFERDLFAACEGKDGLIVDVRNNGGGWTTDRLLSSIMVRPHAYTIPRGADPDDTGHYPQDRLFIARYTLPMNALCNEKSFSNAEIFSHAFKNLGRGTLVGQETWGGVISTGGFGLIDGTSQLLGQQIAAVLVTWAFAALGTFILLKALDWTIGLRVSQQAEIQGLEFELQKNIPVNDWLGFNWLDSKEFRINTNYTFSDSSIEAESEAPFLSQRAVGELTGILSDLEDSILVTLEENSAGDLVLLPNGVGNPDVDGIDAVDLRSPDFNPDRRLQGQSKHLANLQIGFADFDAGSDFNILVNYQSERIRSVESFTSDSPAIVERPPVSVDLVYKRDFTVYGGDYQIGLKAQNILGDEYEAFQESGGERVDVDVYDVGTTFSVSLKRTF